MKKRAFLHITGAVQGVGYRYFTCHEADRLGLSGFVKNTTQGSVDVEAEGEEQDLLTFIATLKTGPVAARVRHVEVLWGPAQLNQEEGFFIRYG